MSEENQSPPPPRPTIKTSAVPLKKETVRITLRANSPDGGAGAPPPPPSPTVPLSPPPRPTTVGVPPPAPAAGAPPRPAPPPAPVGSKTIPLGQTPPRPATPVARPAAGAPASTQPLPKATVKLASAPAPTAPIASAPMRTAQLADDDDEVDEGPLNIMAWIALVASLAVLFFAIASMNEGPLAYGKATTSDQKDSWAKNNAVEDFKLPIDYSPFDTKVGEGPNVNNKYEDLTIPPAPALN